MDIWTPADATEDSKLPVKVFVFGGSNIEGGISDTLYDGCNTADDGAILVSINYRLGPLGFMALESAGIHGNQGIQDLLLGLKWVKNSISAFGGDSVCESVQIKKTYMHTDVAGQNCSFWSIGRRHRCIHHLCSA